MKAPLLTCCLAFVAGSTLAVDTEPQPFFAATERLIEATNFLGSPFSAEELRTLQDCLQAHDAAAVAKAQAVLDAHALFLITISPEQRVKVTAGAARSELDEGGWRQFLVKVVNEAGTTATLKVASPQAGAVFGKGRKMNEPVPAPTPPYDARWVDVQMYEAPPVRPTLSGLSLEYRIVQIYSRDAGKREATFAFDVGQGTQDLGFRGESSVLFDCRPARAITVRVRDEAGVPCMASFLIKDQAQRVYPSQIKRLAPDFGFQPQIYRGDGETIQLPDGKYEIAFQRGPESLPDVRQVEVNAQTKDLQFQVKRWIDPAKRSWWSGDHHIHAAGCAHYTSPTEGVHAPDMARHCQGEDLKIGSNLTWGPCFDYQKQFFTGAEDKVSAYPFLLRYDIEVSGFGSHRSGHLCLLRLKNQMYPGGDSSAHWPTLGLNTLRWAQKQGAVCGPAHSGWGLAAMPPGVLANASSKNSGTLNVASSEVPNFIIPPYDGIGANEYVVDVTHEVEGPDGKPVPAVDFMSMVDTPVAWEMNMWYHTLNAGFRTRISGETDFPCIYGERVGLGRSYVKVDGRLTYDAWCAGIEQGRCYVSDGKSHLMDFKVNDLGVGEKGSEIRLDQPNKIQLTVHAAALLNANPDPQIRGRKLHEKPYWELERARIGDSRNVPVEVIVNGFPVAKKILAADGRPQDLTFDVPITKSSWVALRIFPSSHTNPVFIVVGGKPIRTDKRSVQWCLNGVEQCWKQKESTYDADEMEDAKAAYEHARSVYRARLAETE
ncbi:MAG: CehA/McbA family metallohydrolase [Prosthecobacter sp.]|nr:CehA/McbA family metallohydrolase [Prosthecobacter sp.]